MARASTSTRGRARGMTLVELMVGLAVGLFVVAGAALLARHQMAEARHLNLELQLQQDLRHAADLITRELRRVAHWRDAQRSLPDRTARVPPSNPYAAWSSTAGELTYSYARDAEDNSIVDSADRGGFRLRGGVVEMLLGGAGWQAITDAQTLTVTRLELSTTLTPHRLPCARACGPADADCPPWYQVRDAHLHLTGQAVHDPRVQRSLATRVRLRNDIVTGSCPA